MAVIFAVGGAVVGVLVRAAYDDYGCHNDYSNYSNYSDEAEKLRRQIGQLEPEVNNAVSDLQKYKDKDVNPWLDSHELKREHAMTVSSDAMDQSAKQKIERGISREINIEILSDQMRLEEIESLLRRIQQIRDEERRMNEND